MPRATVEELIAAADADATVVYGVTRSFTAHLLAELSRARPDRSSVVVTPDEATARALRADIGFFLPGVRTPDTPPSALHIPAIDTSPYAELRPDQAALVGRMAALYRLARGGPLTGPIAVVSALSLVRKVMPPAELEHLSTTWTIDQELDRDATARALLRAGYMRTTVVEDPGGFAVKGGVIDVYVPLYRHPIRVELFGDTIESLRFYDPDSQRTLRPVERVHVHPVRPTVPTRGANLRANILAAADRAEMPSRESRRILEQIETGEPFVGIETLTPAFHDRLTPLWNYLQRGEKSPLWLFLDPASIARNIADELEIAESRFEARVEDRKLAFPPQAHYTLHDELHEFLAGLAPRIDARTLEVVGAPGGEPAGESGGALPTRTPPDHTLRLPSTTTATCAPTWSEPGA